MTLAEDFKLKFFFSSTDKMHAEHLGCHVVHPSVLDFWSGRLGWVRQTGDADSPSTNSCFVHVSSFWSFLVNSISNFLAPATISLHVFFGIFIANPDLYKNLLGFLCDTNKLDFIEAIYSPAPPLLVNANMIPLRLLSSWSTADTSSFTCFRKCRDSYGILKSSTH